MGTGHVMRMIALGQAWQDRGGNVIFLCAEVTPSLADRFKSEHFFLQRVDAVLGSAEDLEVTCAAITRAGDNLAFLALDGYQFDADFQLGLKKTGCRLLVADDYGHAGAYHADVILNQNISAHEALYSRRDSNTELLLGPKFALLRKEFVDHSGWKRDIPSKAKKLLVTLGGTDADNVTKKVIDVLAGSGLEVKVAVSGSNPHFSSLRQSAEAATKGATRVELVVNASDMPALMEWADMAMAAGGSTSWELAFTGLPALFIALAKNQEENARTLEIQGFGVYLGRHLEFQINSLRRFVDRLASDSKCRADFASRGREMVDGLGAQRVLSRFVKEEELDFHPVTEADFELLWVWANDPVTRANSFESSPIPWERHTDWCRAKMLDSACSFWTVTNTNLEKIGVVRFDCQGIASTISVSVAPAARGKGCGKKIIAAACDRIFASSGVNLVRALIKPANKASVGAFQHAGFLRGAATMVNGQPAEQYLLHRAS